jgi:hypothetical protein
VQSVSSCVCCGCGDKILSVAGDFMKIIFDEMDLRSLEVIEIARQLLSFLIVVTTVIVRVALNVIFWALFRLEMPMARSLVE